MSDSPDISASLQLDLTGWQRGIRTGLRDVDDFDDAIQDLIDQANTAEEALNTISTDIAVAVDTDFSSVTDAESALASLDTDISATVDVSLSDASTIQTTLDDLTGTQTVKLDVDYSEVGDASDAVIRLDDETPAIPVDVDDTEIGDVQTTVDNLDGETVDIPIETDTSDADKDTQSIEDKLDTLRNLAVINIAMNLVGKIPGPEDIPLLQTIIDADAASRSLVANLGDMGKANAPTYTQGAQDVYASGAFDSQQAAADAYAETVRQTHNELGDLTTTGENFAKVTEQGFATAKSSGADFNAIISTADTLVSTGLATSYEDAFDIINTGFQEGLDKGGQFLDTLNEKSTVFVDMGVDAQTALGLLKIGLDNGAKSAAEVGEVIGSLNTKIQEAASGSGTTYDLFKKLGLKDEVKAVAAGKETGGQFLTAMLAAINEKQGTRGFDQAGVMGLFGGKVEDLTLPVVMKFDPAQAQTAISDIKGTTLDTQLQVMGDLGTSWETLKRTVETELASSVSSAFDIPGKIKQFSEGVAEFSQLIQGGSSIPEAIEVAFNVPGLADTIARLESTLGNLGITIMQAAANILDATGHGDAATGVRGTIADLGAQQLTYDLKLADDGDDFSQSVRTAMERGVSSADISKAVGTAGQEMMGAGDMEGAQQLLGVLQEMSQVTFPEDMQAFLTGQGIDPTNIEASRDALIAYKAEVDRVAGGEGGMITAFNTNNLDAAIKSTDVAAAAQSALAPLQDEYQKAEDAVTTHFENMRLSAESKLPGMAETATSSLGPVTTSVDLLGHSFTATDDAFNLMGDGIAGGTAIMAGTLDTATGDVDDFANNANVAFVETVGGGVTAAQLIFDAFGVSVQAVMEGAAAQVQTFMDKFLSIGSMDVTVPTPGVGGGSSGGGGGGEFAAGGVAPAGQISTVHGGEQMIAPGEDIAVLNRQTSSAIDGAIAQYMAAAGMGGGGSTTVTNYNTFNFTNNGAAAAASSLQQANQIRGY